MNIKSAEFVKGVMGEDEILEDGLPEIAFVGRSNVGKSSVINALVNRNSLARSSTRAGKTTEINFFLINRSFYLVDLPGYGYAKGSAEDRENLRKLIYWYLLYSEVKHKAVVLIIDAIVGFTEMDLEMLRRLVDRQKNIIIVANKIDKIRKSDYPKKIANLQQQAGLEKIIFFSSKNKIGLGQLTDLITK